MEEFEANPKQILEPAAVYQLVDIMTDNSARTFIFGANSPLTLAGRTVAAKTGTSQNWRDVWTLGFTPSLAAGVWAGNNDGTLLKRGADGVLVAAPIWNEFMKKALEGKPVEHFAKPDSILSAIVDSVSGKLPTANTPASKAEIFAEYNLPAEYDNVHLTFAYDLLTGSPADSATPADRIFYKTFKVFHSEQPHNPDWENAVRKWALKNGFSYPENGFVSQPGKIDSELKINIDSPQDGGIVETIPFSVVIDTSDNSQIARVDLFIDGQFFKSINSQPYRFEINRNLSFGQHIIAAKATSKSGNVADTSIAINFGSAENLYLTDPSNDTLALFPITLTAESGKRFDSVSFYYLSGSKETFIGNAVIENVGGRYRYVYKWNNKPEVKTFQVYAKSSDGAETKKIKITTP